MRLAPRQGVGEREAGADEAGGPTVGGLWPGWGEASLGVNCNPKVSLCSEYRQCVVGLSLSEARKAPQEVDRMRRAHGGAGAGAGEPDPGAGAGQKPSSGEVLCLQLCLASWAQTSPLHKGPLKRRTDW